MVNIKHKKEKIGIILCLLFFCQQFLTIPFPIFSYIDELAVLYFLFYSILHGSRKIKKTTFWILLLGLILLGLTFIYNFQYLIQNSNIAIILDAFNCSKFFIVAICCERYFKNIDTDYFVCKIGKIFSKITYILLFFSIVNLFIDIGMRDGMRYGLFAFKFICENSGQFNYCCYFIVSILTAYYFVMPKRSFIPICSALILFSLTLRARTFVFIGIYLFLFVYFTKTKKTKKIVIIGLFLFMIPLFYSASYSQINKYFMNDDVARSRLLKEGIKVFQDYFPWGTGFATYGTAQAAFHYTPLYYKYGLNKVWGLYPENPAFASDSFWPSIIAQLGAVGSIIYIIMLFIVFNLYRKKFENSKYKVTFYFIVVIIALSSIVTASFYHSTTIGMMMLVSILSQNRNKEVIQ